jgi:type II secretion system protein H
MATSAATSSEPAALPSIRGRAAGFTLLEITLVILIVSVMVALTVPRLRDRGRTELESQGRRLAAVFRLVRSEAILSGSAYRVNYDLDAQRYWVTPEDATLGGADFIDDYRSLANGKVIEYPVGMIDVVLPTLAGKIVEGQIYTVFYPDGSIDPTVIHLATENDASTLWLDPIRSRLRVEWGYHEVSY